VKREMSIPDASHVVVWEESHLSVSFLVVTREKTLYV
jgi:hypothetical protein